MPARRALFLDVQKSRIRRDESARYRRHLAKAESEGHAASQEGIETGMISGLSSDFVDTDARGNLSACLFAIVEFTGVTSLDRLFSFCFVSGLELIIFLFNALRREERGRRRILERSAFPFTPRGNT